MTRREIANLAKPSDHGFYMPAEWRTHAATWLSWPKDPLTWPDRVPLVQEIFLEMIAALSPHEQVNLLVDDQDTEELIRRRCAFPTTGNLRFHQIPTVDSWIRDYGPNFIINDRGELAYNDFIFNAWGEKYAELKRDDAIPSQLEAKLGIPRFEPRIVLEGGAIDVNGSGCVLTTEQCLLNKNRNPRLTRDQIEQYLRDYLGVTKVLWLKEGIVGDDTDGHIDDIARFVSSNTIVCAVEEDPLDANYEILQENLRRLDEMTDANGQRFRIVPLPMPGFVAGSTDATERNLERLPASYANFYIANNVVLAPVFGHSNDERAIETLQSLFKDRRVLPLNCEPLVWGMGTIHCVTQQQPDSTNR